MLIKKENFEKLDKILANFENVYLIISNLYKKEFIGYAKMITAPDDMCFVQDDIDENYNK